MKIKQAHDYLVYLTECALKDAFPEKLNNCSLNLKSLFDLAVQHRIENMIYLPLAKIESFKGSAPEKIMSEYHLHSVVREAQQQLAAETIMDEFEKNGIVHMPLKGYIIKNLYPSPDLRQSTDFDVYVPKKFNEQAREIMDKLGYSYDKEHIGFGMHDEYMLGDAVIIEIHRNLMAPEFPHWCSLCDEIITHMTPEDGYSFRYKFSPEDYYIYMQMHTIKHLKFSSTGIKSIADIWIYLNKYKDELNWEYIDNMFDKAGVKKADENLRALSDYWFNDIEPSDNVIYKLSDYIILNGAFGTQEQYLSGRSTDESRMTRIFRAVFKPYDEMALKYPILKKMPFLLPFAWIYRAAAAVILRKESVNVIKGTENKIDISYAEELSKFKREIGL